MTNDLIELLNKFGEWEDKNDNFYQCRLEIFSNNCYLNIINKKLKAEAKYKWEQITKEMLQCEYPQELREIYENCNGFILFSHSLVLFGIKLASQKGHSSVDIIEENIFLTSKGFKEKYNNFYSFGYYGNYYFCLNKDVGENVIVVSLDDLEIKHTFKSIKETYKYYIEKLIDEYYDNGLKIHVDPLKKRIPLRNRTTKYL